MSLDHTLTRYLQGFLILVAFALLSGCYDNNSPNTSGTRSTGVVMLPGGQDTREVPDDVAQNDSSGTDQDDFSDLDSNPDEAESPYTLTLSWRPSTGFIDGYMIFHGPTPESATALLSITLETTVHFDPTMDLGLNAGDASCFRIKAYNAEGSSEFSDAVCFTYT